jgi:DNA repair exonuclease SbcCD ATPase subunit
VLVEFLTSYDSSALQTLEAQLKGLDKTQSQLDKSRQQAVRQRAASQAVITRIGNLEQTLTKGQNKLLKESIDLQKKRQQQLDVARRSPAGSPERSDALKQAAGLSAQIRVNEEALTKSTGLRKRDISLLLNSEKNIANAKNQQAAAGAKIRSIDNSQLQLGKERLTVEQKIGQERGRVGTAVGKLGSLALGAIGGLVGGAVIGLGFSAVQAGLDAIGGALTDIIDPANHARESIKSVSDEIKGLADSDGVDFLEATRRKLSELGPLADGLNPKIIAQAAAIEQVNKQLDLYNQLADIQKNADELRKEAIQKRVQQLEQESEVLKKQTAIISGTRGIVAPGSGAASAAAAAAAEKQRILAQATREVDAAAAAAANSVGGASDAENRLGAAASFAALRQGMLASALQDVANTKIGQIDQQIDNLPTTSAHTQAIQNQIDQLNAASQAAALQQQIADIDTERANVLLEGRLSLLQQTVNIEQYAGQQRLIAIQHNISALQNATFAEEAQISAIDAEIKATERANAAIERKEKAQLDAINKQIEGLQKADKAQDEADQKILDGYDEKIDALQKESDALDRVNKLLDLQYQSQQKLTRNQGESIGDFLDRRAQENRKSLLEFQKLRIEDQIATIRGERDKAESAIKAENDRREAVIKRMEEERDALQEEQQIRREERQMHLQALQDERERLQAILERHQKANQAAIAALQQEADRTQREIKLHELAEQKKQLLADETKRKKLAALDAELKASQDADRKALQSRKDALEKEKRAVKDAYDRMIDLLDSRHRTELLNMIKFANTTGDLALLSGQISAVKSLIGELQGMLASGVTGAMRDSIEQQIAELQKILIANQGKLRSKYGSVTEGAATGGVFPLTNASTIFGSNIRTGEEGPELGVVLSNKVVQALRERNGENAAQFGDINLFGSTNPLADEYRLKRAVRDAMAESL